MKMKVIFLLVASVFFVSCGMPTIFAPNTSEYTLMKSLPDPGDNNVKGKMAMHVANPGINHDLLEDTSTKGPSLMFFYTFDNNNDISYKLTSNEINSIISKFAEEYVKNKYEGITVDASKEILSVKFKDSVTDMDKEVYLYGVSPQGVSNVFNARDQYVLYASDKRNQAALNHFTLAKEDNPPSPNGTEYTLKLSWANALGSTTVFKSNAPSNLLYAYDGQSFSLQKEYVKTKIRNGSNHEYAYLGEKEIIVETVPESIRMHLFAAFFVSGPFSNNFWSRLVHLDSIPITLL